MRLTQFKIGTRLGAGFAVLMTLMLIVAGVGVLHMMQIQEKLDGIAKVGVAETKLVYSMRSLVYQKQILVRNMILMTKVEDMKAELEKIRENRKEIDEVEKKLSVLFALPGTTEDEKALFSRINESEDAVKPLVDKAVELGFANRNEEATKVLFEDMKEPQRVWLDQLDQLVQIEDSLDKQAEQQAEKAYASGKIQMLALSAIALLFGAITALLLTRSITRPVDHAVEVATRVAEGDLTSTIRVESSDEIGKLMQALSTMNGNLANLIRQARENSKSVSDASCELSSAASQVAASSQSQSEAASSMAAAVEEMSVSVNQISDHAGSAEKIAIESGALAEEGSQVIGKMISMMGDIATTVNESSRVMEELGQQSEQIADIVNMIKEIAEQTNLLALNAAIEAARAGEQGRGFAVVADEVRKLAERTANSTLEISSVIEKVREGISSVMESMHEGVSQANQGMQQAGQTSEAIGRINAGSQKVVGTVNDIGSALREQSVANNEIAVSVEKIAQMIEENNAAVDETAKTARGLEQLASNLHDVVARFRV